MKDLEAKYEHLMKKHNEIKGLYDYVEKSERFIKNFEKNAYKEELYLKDKRQYEQAFSLLAMTAYRITNEVDNDNSKLKIQSIKDKLKCFYYEYKAGEIKEFKEFLVGAYHILGYMYEIVSNEMQYLCQQAKELNDEFE